MHLGVGQSNCEEGPSGDVISYRELTGLYRGGRQWSQLKRRRYFNAETKDGSGGSLR